MGFVCLGQTVRLCSTGSRGRTSGAGGEERLGGRSAAATLFGGELLDRDEKETASRERTPVPFLMDSKTRGSRRGPDCSLQLPCLLTPSSQQ